MPDPQSKSIPEVLVDLKDLTVTYAKQETIEPLKGLGRFFKFGAGGAVLTAIGFVELTLFLLRVLQTETGPHLTGHWSWVPYLGAMVFAIGVAVVFALLIKQKPKEPRS